MNTYSYRIVYFEGKDIIEVVPATKVNKETEAEALSYALSNLPSSYQGGKDLKVPLVKLPYEPLQNTDNQKLSQ